MQRSMHVRPERSAPAQATLVTVTTYPVCPHHCPAHISRSDTSARPAPLRAAPGGGEFLRRLASDALPRCVAPRLFSCSLLGCADARNVSSSNLIAHGAGLPDPVRIEGAVVSFRRVALNAPDGTALVRELTFEVPRGRSCLIMGPNGGPPADSHARACCSQNMARPLTRQSSACGRHLRVHMTYHCYFCLTVARDTQFHASVRL